MPDGEMKPESLNVNREPLTGAPALGATHAENAGLTGSAAWMEGFRQAGEQTVGELSTLGPERGGGGDAEEMLMMRRWRKEQMLRRPAELDLEIGRIKDKIRAGTLYSSPEPIVLRDGTRLDTSVGDILRELLLARSIYLSAAEAARLLREHELMVQHEIDEYHLSEIGVGVAGTPFIIRSDGTPVQKKDDTPFTHKDYLSHVEAIQQLIEESPELRDFRKTVETLRKEYGDHYSRRKRQRFRRHELVGLMPSAKDLPFWVPFREAMKELKRLAPESQRKMTEEEVIALKMKEREEVAKAMEQFGLFAGQRDMTGEYYIDMYQDSWDEGAEAIKSFPDDDQDEIVANFFAGGSILGGQYAAFYRKSAEQTGRFPSKWTPWLDAIEKFQLMTKQKGYLPMDQIFQMIGSIEQEVLAFPDFLKSTHEMYFSGDTEPRRFEISTTDVMGQLGKLEVLAKLGVNDAYRPGEGMFAVRNGEFAEYLLRQAGFEPEEARQIAYSLRELVTPVIRDRWMSPVRRREVSNYWDWVGEVVLSKLVVALAWLKWSRADLEFAPWDFKRRWILSLRGLEMAAYRIGYSLGLPPEQFLNMIALFGSALTIEHEAMLGWVGEKWCGIPAEKWSEFKPGTPEFNSLSKEQQLRATIWRETISLERPSLASSRELAKIALGIGSYNKTGVEYRKAVREGMRKIPPAKVKALRYPDIWKWRWFENADGPTDAWRYTGHFDGGPSLADVQAAFAGYDFTEELQRCGLSEREIQELRQRRRTIGFEGWKSLLDKATIGLMNWRRAKHTLGDQTWRYEAKKEKLQDTTLAFLNVGSGEEPLALSVEAPGSAGLGWGTNLPRISADKFKRNLEEAVGKILEAITETSGFILNSTQRAYAQAVVQMFVEGHVAHKLDAYVEDLELSELEDGDNFSVRVVEKGDIEKAAPDRLAVLQREGYFFTKDPNTGKEYLISPISAPVSHLTTARSLLDRIEGVFKEKRILSDRQEYLKKAVDLMKTSGFFCWDTLIRGECDVPLGKLTEVLGEKKVGLFAGATGYAILRYLVRFAREHHSVRLNDEKEQIPKLL